MMCIIIIITQIMVQNRLICITTTMAIITTVTSTINIRRVIDNDLKLIRPIIDNNLAISQKMITVWFVLWRLFVWLFSFSFSTWFTNHHLHSLQIIRILSFYIIKRLQYIVLIYFCICLYMIINLIVLIISWVFLYHFIEPVWSIPIAFIRDSGWVARFFIP